MDPHLLEAEDLLEKILELLLEDLREENSLNQIMHPFLGNDL